MSIDEKPKVERTLQIGFFGTGFYASGVRVLE